MREERAIYAGLVAVCTPVVTVAVVHGDRIGPGTTVAGLLALAGIVGLVRSYRHRRKLPKAQARQR